MQELRQKKGEDFNYGIGIGLSITKKILECLGGEIRVRSQEGRGSTFKLKMPCSSIIVNFDYDVNSLT